MAAAFVLSTYLSSREIPREDETHYFFTTNFYHSYIGEHNIQPGGDNIVLTGGYFGSCYKHTLLNLIKDLKPQKRAKLRIIIPMDAVYESNKFVGIKHSDTALRSCYQGPYSGPIKIVLDFI